ncbi:hypothetical protein PQ43W_38 [Ralstonia phage PQ43W]
MSYGFNIRVKDKAATKVAVDKELATIVARDPAHSLDRAAALANAITAINLLPDDDTHDVAVSCGGSLGWRDPVPVGSVPEKLNAVNISASAWLAPRE